MKINSGRLLLALASGAVLLAGCGGGGGGTPVTTTQPPSITLAGVAATGAPFAGAALTVFDKTGTVAGTTTVADSGTYSITLSGTVQAPFVLEAVRDDRTLVSTFAEAKSTTLNVTPLTTLIAARLAPDGDPASLKTNATVVTADKLNAKVIEVSALIQPLLTAVGDTVNPLTGSFSATGTGHDKVLDSLAITIHPTGTSSNIEIAVRTSTAEPQVISFVSNETAPAPLTAPIAPADLVVDGTAQMLSDLASRLTACYALPVGTRVDSTATTATAANVVAPACRTLFVNDDPASYKNSGSVVSAQGAFSGLFRDGATGVVFDRAALEFLRNNAEKDLVFSYRTTNLLGNVAYDTLVARNVSNVLKLIGNQYIYSMRVRPLLQDREFLNQGSATYLSTGYNVFINNLQSGGSPVFSKVVVTTPKGNTLTFKPRAGRSALVIARPDGTLSNTSVIRLAARFADPNTPGTPSQYETSAVFASPAFTEDEIRNIPEQGLWKAEFFHTDTTKANVIQASRTLSRAPTLAEAALVPLAQLTATAKTEVRTDSAANGYFMFGAPSTTDPNVADLSTLGGGDFWTVPTGALAPIHVTVYGRAPAVPNGSGGFTPGAPFDDGTGVAPAARKAIIYCSSLGGADKHCDTTYPSQYAQNTTVNSLQLFAVSPRFVELSKMNAVYYLLAR